MHTLLHLRNSPLGTQSVSRTVGQHVVEALGGVVTVRDLAAQPLPHWSPAWAGTSQAQAVIDELLATEVLVIEAPMYNFGIPSTLKAWFDTVAVAGRTFHYTAEGPVGHLVALRVVIVSSRGGAYADAHPADFQETYLRFMLGFLGVSADRIEVVRAQGVAMGETARNEALAQAQQGAVALAGRWPR